jgi:CBS domain-containing protein
MTTDVTTMRDSASVSEIADMLTQRQISATPVVDQFGAVIGVVSWTDLHNKIEIDGPDGDPSRTWLHRRVHGGRTPQQWTS